MSIEPAASVLQKLRPRDAVERMHEYHPPLAGRDGLRLDFNENTFAPSPRVQAVLQRIAAETLTKYPERHHVEQIVAKHFGLADDAVLLTNGVDEAIHLLCETYLEPQDEAVIVTPTFSMYALYAEATGARIREVQADSTLQFPYGQIQKAIGPSTRLIMLASPNNPTGAVVDTSFLLELAAHDPAGCFARGRSVLPFPRRVGSICNFHCAKSICSSHILQGLRPRRAENWTARRPS